VVGRRILLVTAALALAGCGGSGDAGIAGPPPTGLVAALEDEVTGASWRTSWVLCWDDQPGAVAYELMTVTGEGASPKLRRQAGRCLRVEAAAGEGPVDERPARRAAQLAAQQGQLAFQVRTVPVDGPPGRWSPAVAVGTEGPAGP
jgi:hypothetical protein